MSYVPTTVIVPPQEITTCARNLSLKIQEVIKEAHQANPSMTPQEIATALQLATPKDLAKPRAALVGAVVGGLILLGLLMLAFFAVR
jgi:hypothetical protein